MNRPMVLVPVLLSYLLAGCRGSAPPKQAEPVKSAETKKGVIVLSPAEQAAGQIETQAVTTTDAPPVIRVSGRIARKSRSFSRYSGFLSVAIATLYALNES